MTCGMGDAIPSFMGDGLRAPLSSLFWSSPTFMGVRLGLLGLVPSAEALGFRGAEADSLRLSSGEVMERAPCPGRAIPFDVIGAWGAGNDLPDGGASSPLTDVLSIPSGGGEKSPLRETLPSGDPRVSRIGGISSVGVFADRSGKEPGELVSSWI